MSRRRTSLSAGEARRVALAAQDFDRPRPAAPTDVRHFRRALHAIGVLQLDFVNVLMPAHFLMLWSRLGGYDRQRFERFLYDSRCSSTAAVPGSHGNAIRCSCLPIPTTTFPESSRRSNLTAL